MKQFYMLLIVFTATGISMGQSPTDLSLHIYGAISMPSGDFGKEMGEHAIPTRRFGFDIGEKVGLATTGYGGGAELSSPVWFKGLQWIFSVNYLSNPVKKSALEPVYNHELSDSTRNVDVRLEFDHWINLPILSGFRYDHYLSSNFAIYALVQGGMNFSRRPSQKAMVDIIPTENSSVNSQENILAEDTNYEFARDFGYGAGAGVLINQRFNLGVRYYQLNHPKYEGTRKLSETVFPDIFQRESEILGEERSISMIIMTLGIKLN